MKYSDFLEKYDNKGIEDWGTANSDAMKNFFKEFKNSVKNDLKDTGIVIDKIGLNHYFFSGFLKKNDKYVYFSFDVPRGNFPINIDSSDCCLGMLIRTATNNTDYRGGTNHFTSLRNFIVDSNKLFM